MISALGWEDPLEKEMAISSSTIAWKIPWTEGPGRLQSMGLQSRTRLSDFTSTKKEGGSYLRLSSNNAWGTMLYGLQARAHQQIFCYCLGNNVLKN